MSAQETKPRPKIARGGDLCVNLVIPREVCRGARGRGAFQNIVRIEVSEFVEKLLELWDRDYGEQR